MSQATDYVLSNQSGASFRAELNTILAAIASANSGATEPTTTYAYMLWADESSGILKQRNAADNAWIDLLTLSTGAAIAIPDNIVTTAKIADDAVTLVKLENAAKTDKIQPITASVGSNALTITLNPTVLDFRSSTLGSGTVSTRKISAAISVVVSSGSTLGTISAQQSRLAVLAIDNAGTVELAVGNLAGGTNLDETGVISTTAEGGAGAADSATVIYSATARTNVAYRVVGFVESTQATAGTWATAPSKIQGYGGQAFAAFSSIGYGQTWQDLTASRTFATVYYNTTGKPIMVSVGISAGSAVNQFANMVIDGLVVARIVSKATADGVDATGQFIIPTGSSYEVTRSGTPSIRNWSELR